MTVYVDTMRAKLGRLIMCHMVSDDLDELHAMAENLGVRQHFQCRKKSRYLHYDVCLSKRAQAIELGAKECDMRTALRVAKALTLKHYPPPPSN